MLKQTRLSHKSHNLNCWCYRNLNIHVARCRCSKKQFGAEHVLKLQLTSLAVVNSFNPHYHQTSRAFSEDLLQDSDVIEQIEYTG